MSNLEADTSRLQLFSLAASSGGAIRSIKTTPLLSTAEAIATIKKAATSGYKAPGSAAGLDSTQCVLPSSAEANMDFETFTFGSIRIDGVTYEHDLVIDRGKVAKRKKKPSKKFRAAFGHTPISIKEKVPWKCSRLVIGTGTGALPVMNDVKQEAKRRKIKLIVLPTKEAIKILKANDDETNAIFHVTC